ncbi:MAG: hypothetical protein IJP95_00120 [Bacteroidales bacterium]|nr:hypothetical protein [Bacteroidales bacterium]
MHLKERWQKLTQTERLLIVSIVLLSIMLATRLPHTVQRAKDGFNYFRHDADSTQTQR